jgi:hypothetical protein
MTSPLSKNRRITRWNILGLNRLDWPAGVLLFAASTGFAVSGLADDAPTPRPAVSLETLRQQSPAQRWERVKAQSAPMEAQAAPKVAASRPGVILPLPEDDIAIAPSELKLAPALPSATEEPYWILPARPLPADEELVPTPDVSEAVIAPTEASSPAEATSAPLVARSVEPLRAQVGVNVAAQEPTPVESPATTPMVKPLNPRRLKTIQEITPYYDTAVDKDIREYAVKQAGEYNVAFGSQTYAPRSFPDAMYAWEPSNFYHYPLYFEDAVLERYGHTYHPLVQPVVSVAKFSTQLVLLPYQMALDPIDRPMYSLGWYRPGDCAPKLRYQPPLNAKAAAVEAGVVTGLFFIIP